MDRQTTSNPSARGSRTLDGTVLGAAAGVALAIAALLGGPGGALLALALGALGALVGAAVTGRLDLRAALDAARGRRVG